MFSALVFSSLCDNSTLAEMFMDDINKARLVGYFRIDRWHHEVLKNHL